MIGTLCHVIGKIIEQVRYGIPPPEVRERGFMGYAGMQAYKRNGRASLDIPRCARGPLLANERRVTGEEDTGAPSAPPGRGRTP